MSGGFGDRLDDAIRARGSCLVVGLDPVLEKLPPEVLSSAQRGAGPGAPESVRAGVAFGLFLREVIEVVADHAVAVKPNLAFFERYGAPGWECFREVCRWARQAGLLVIADAKRGDIGHTAEAYAQALLGDLPESAGPSIDAVTISPYLARDGIVPFLEAARARDKGIFVLVRTSNPSAGDLQDLEVRGGDGQPRPLYLEVARQLHELAQGLEGASGLSPVGAVVGATVPEQARLARAALPSSPFLVPGYGAQGGGLDGLRSCFRRDGSGAVVNASRSILFPPPPKGSGGTWSEAVRAAARRAQEELEAVRGSLDTTPG